MKARQSGLWGSLAGNFVAEAFLRIPSFIWDAWAARKLSRFEFGVWIGFRLLLQVTPYVQGVTLFGLDLRYSHLVGASQDDHARETAGSALIATVLFTMGLVLLLLPGLVSGTVLNALVPGATRGQLGVLIGIITTQTFYAVIGTHLRNRLRFNSMNLGLVIGNTAGLAALFVLLPSLRVYGCLFAFSITVVTCTLSWLRHVDLKIPTRNVFWTELKELTKLGLPLVVAGAVLDGLRLIGRWFVSHTNGVEALGTYGAAYLFGGIVFLAGTSSSRVLVQFMGRAEGARVSRDVQAVRFLFIPGLAVAAVASVSAVAVWILAQAFLPWWAPRQAAALGVIRPAIYGSLPFAIAFLYMTLLRAQGRLRELNLATGGTFVFYVVILGAVAAKHASLWAFVSTEAACFAILAIVLIGWTGRSLGTARWRFLGTLLVVFGATILSIEVGTRASHGAGSLLTHSLIQAMFGVVGVALWGPLAWRSARRMVSESRDADAGAPTLNAIAT
jgi:O-antigen/teichoic acid export membrane protein